MKNSFFTLIFICLFFNSYSSEKVKEKFKIYGNCGMCNEVITKADISKGKTFYAKKEDPGNELLSNFITKWHKEKLNSVSEGTFKRLAYDLKNYIIPTLGSIRLCDISYDHAVHLRTKMK